MSLDSITIDRIVAGVLEQLGGAERAQLGDSRATAAATEGRRDGGTESKEDVGEVELSERIVTAEVLESAVNGCRSVVVGPKAIITPAARDVAKELGITFTRSGQQASPRQPAGAPQPPLNSQLSTLNSPLDTGHSTLNSSSLLAIVRHTDAVARLWDDLQSTWRRELLGCPDDAAKLAINELSRGGAATVVILAEQTHRAACLANRTEAVKAVAVRDALDVKSVRQELKANVWCIDPTGRSWFELRNLLNAIMKG